MKIESLDSFSRKVAESALNEIIVEIDGVEMSLKEFLEKLKTDYSLVRKDQVMRRDEFPIIEEFANDVVRKELKLIISEAEDHIANVRIDHPVYHEYYELGENHILDIVKLHLKWREEKNE